MATLDTPYEFVQTEIAFNGEKIIIKIRGKLVNIPLENFQERMINMSGKKERRIFFT